MRHAIVRVFVQIVDVRLEPYFGRHLLCIQAPTCGYVPALEYNGDQWWSLCHRPNAGQLYDLAMTFNGTR